MEPQWPAETTAEEMTSGPEDVIPALMFCLELPKSKIPALKNYYKIECPSKNLCPDSGGNRRHSEIGQNREDGGCSNEKKITERWR